MAGIYIHVPFCRQACRYCDFSFTVSLKFIGPYLSTLVKEIKTREHLKEKIDTIYFGGGTPSVLTGSQISALIEKLAEFYDISDKAEVTMEANPDDLSPEYLTEIRGIGINRLSIGIQSFHKRDLELMNRSHSAEQAKQCLADAKKAGFDNINLDLIYGIPGQSLSEWEENVKTAIESPVQHISAYHLTFEEGTIFNHWKNKGRLQEVEDEDSVKQYEILRAMTGKANFEHYEISNFALEGYKSRHNTSYWNQTPYDGFGPSAHSFKDGERRWNVSSARDYVGAIRNEEIFFESEKLSVKDRFHDLLLTTLRTNTGADLGAIKSEFGDAMMDHLITESKPFIESGEMKIEDNSLIITPEGWLKADFLIRKMMLPED